MSTLTYNKIQLDILRTLRYQRQPIYDAQRVYLYTRHTIHVQAVFNPASTSYDTTKEDMNHEGVDVGGNASVIQGGAKKTTGQNANLTDRAIRHLLMQPRSKLIYTSGGVDIVGNPDPGVTTFAGSFQETQILESPYKNRGGNPPEYFVDASNGPKPLDCTVWRIDGTGTFRVEYTIQTDVNEAHFFFSKPPILLSQTWTVSQDVDDCGFTTRTINGIAIFRRDVLQQQAVRPDDFRGLLLHPIPNEFKRTRLSVRQEDDGNTIHYQIVDEEYSDRVNFTNVMKIEAFCRVGMNMVSAEEIAAITAANLASLPGNTFVGGLVSAYRASVSILPSAYLDATIKVWGNKCTTLKYLRECALRILYLRTEGDPVGKTFTHGCSITCDEGYDWVGRYVEVHWRFKAAGLVAAFQIMADAFAAKDDPQPVFHGFDKVGNGLFKNVRMDNTAEPAPLEAGQQWLSATLFYPAPGGAAPGAQVKPLPPRGFRTDFVQNGPNTQQIKDVRCGPDVTFEDGAEASYLETAVAQAFWDSSLNPPAPPNPAALTKKKASFNY